MSDSEVREESDSKVREGSDSKVREGSDTKVREGSASKVREWSDSKVSLHMYNKLFVFHFFHQSNPPWLLISEITTFDFY